MNKEIMCGAGMVMGFIILVLSAFGGKKFLDLGDGAFGLGFVGFVVLIGSLIAACQ